MKSSTRTLKATRQRLSTLVVLCSVFLTAACAGGGIVRYTHPNPMINQALAELGGPNTPTFLGSASNRILDGSLLNGLDKNDVKHVLGTPNRYRLDLPAQVWQYDLSHCFVDVFLFDEGFGPRVVYVQERSRQVKKVTPGICLSKVWQDQRMRQK